LQPETVKELILLKSWGIKDLEELNSYLQEETEQDD